MLYWTLMAAVLAADLPSIDVPLRTGVRSERDAAVVIGIEEYAFVQGVPYAKRDADSVRDLFLYTLGIPEPRIRLLNRMASKELVFEAVSAAALDVGAEGTVWVYYAGHGAASPSTLERMWLGIDVQPIDTSLEARGIGVDQIERAASASGARVIMMADSCYSGVGRGGASLLPGKRFAVPAYVLQSQSRVMQWNAAGPNELSGPLEPVRHGAFTYFAVGALRGWADGEISGERDGEVTAREASAYVKRALRAAGVRDQVPVLTVSPGDDWVLSKGTEQGPSFGAAVSVAPTSAPAPAPGDAEGLRLPTLEVESSVARDTTGDVEDILAALATAERKMVARGARDWERTRAFAESHAGTEQALQAIRKYIDEYDKIEVSIEGETRRPTIPQRDHAARVLLATLPRPAIATPSAPSLLTVQVPAGTYKTTAAYGATIKVVLTQPLVWTTTEITQGQFEAITGLNPVAERTEFWGAERFFFDCSKVGVGADLPVVCVDLYDVVAFANGLSVAQGLAPAYRLEGPTLKLDPGASGWRLPTDAEWGFAAAAGAKGSEALPQGDPGLCALGNFDDETSAQDPSTDEYANAACNDGVALLALVGSYQPNAFGLYDMHGNASEWVWGALSNDAKGKQVDPMVGTHLSGVDASSRSSDWLSPTMGSAYNGYQALFYEVRSENALANVDNLGFRLVRR